jgi:hypothetical protein
MFHVFDGANSIVKKMKTYDACTYWLHVHYPLSLSAFSIGETGDGYHSDRIVKLWKYNLHTDRYQRVHPETGHWL